MINRRTAPWECGFAVRSAIDTPIDPAIDNAGAIRISAQFAVRWGGGDDLATRGPRKRDPVAPKANQALLGKGGRLNI